MMLTIIFQMEPWIYNATKNWGVRTWGKWSRPDEKKFLYVGRHKNHLNNVQWEIKIPSFRKGRIARTYGVYLPRNRTLNVWKNNGLDPSRFVSVGVDEYVKSENGGNLSEVDWIPFGESADGEKVYGQGIATSPPHLILSPMNYGNVWMQGVDISLTQLIPEYNLVIDGNISWYGTTDFYNELTK